MLENIHDPHNVSAIFRTCDAVGIPKISLVYNEEKFPKIGKKSSASAYKWVEKEKFSHIGECYRNLRNEGFTIYATALNPVSLNLYDLDFTKNIAIVLGNEHRGASDEAINEADASLFIPMYGMVQSLNVSVATAVIIYEALRQRKTACLYDKSFLSDSDLENLINQYLKK